MFTETRNIVEEGLLDVNLELEAAVFLRVNSTIEIMRSSDDSCSESLVDAARMLEPDVILLQLKTLKPATVKQMELLREACPESAMVLVFNSYDVQGIKALREFSWGTYTGCAYLLNHTLHTAEQLAKAIYGAAEGRMVVDSPVMRELMGEGDIHAHPMETYLMRRQWGPIAPEVRG